jgi:hypothetical protein
MNERTKAAVIGGAVAGVLSIIPVVNYCCCLWALGGGALAVYLYVKSGPPRMTPGDGAMLGAIAGGVGAAIYLVISIPLSILIGAAMMQAQMEQMRQAGIDIPFGGMALMVVGAIMGAIGIAVLTTLGGLIGAAIFGKNVGTGTPPPPPPPSGFGGPTGGSFGGPAGGGFGGPAGGGGYGQNP